MKLPSLTHLAEQAAATFRRFSGALIAATVATGVAVFLVEVKSAEAFDSLFKISMIAVLGIALFTVLPLMGERKAWGRPLIIGSHVTVFILLIGYYFWLPVDLEQAPYYHTYRFVLYFVGAHLLVAIGPYWGTGETENFWQYNKTLFLRILTAILFSGVLFVGLSIALGPIEFLFAIDIASQRYMQLFLLIAGIFNTWFFLAGIPAPLSKLDHIATYPKGLKIFTQNVLLPLVIIYVIILYLYMGKIILQWAWPEGWIATLVLSFSIVGILANLLLYPLRNKTDNRWIKRFATGYYGALVPLTVLLLLAIWRRIDEYGFTVERYFVLAAGLWLAGVVGYFIISRSKNIKIIPASLCIIIFLISFGPWGVFTVSEWSQMNRLKYYLKQHDILKNGVIHKTIHAVPFYDRKQISSSLSYLANTHGLDELQPWFQHNLTDSTRISKITEWMGIDYVDAWEDTDNRAHDSTQGWLKAEPPSGISLENYDWLVQDIELELKRDTLSQTIDKQEWRFILKPDSMQIVMKNRDDPDQKLEIPMASFLIRLIQSHGSKSVELPSEKMVLTASNKQVEVKLYIHFISWHEKNGSRILDDIQFDVLLNINRK